MIFFMCKPYNEFKKTLEDYDKAIVNETDSVKKQELITLKIAFLWENPVMYRVYKAVQGKNIENVDEVVSNLINE